MFQKINEKLDPNSRLRVSNYVKGTKGESNASLDYSGFQNMMKSCKLDDRLSGKEVRTAFDFLSRGGEKSGIFRVQKGVGSRMEHAKQQRCVNICAKIKRVETEFDSLGKRYDVRSA